MKKRAERFGTNVAPVAVKVCFTLIHDFHEVLVKLSLFIISISGFSPFLNCFVVGEVYIQKWYRIPLNVDASVDIILWAELDVNT